MYKQLQKYGTFCEIVTQHLHTRVAKPCTSFQGDVLPLSPPMKSTGQSSSIPYTGQSAADSITMRPQASSQPNSGMGTSAVNASGGSYPSSSVPGISPAYPPVRPSTVSQATYLSPGPSIQAYPSQFSLSPSMPPPRRDPYPQSQLGAVRGASPSSLFAPKTAAELGLLDRPDTSYEGMELSSIVDRMTSAFPLDVHSGTTLYNIKCWFATSLYSGREKSCWWIMD